MMRSHDMADATPQDPGPLDLGPYAGEPPADPNDFDFSSIRLDPDVPIEAHQRALETVRAWFTEAGLSLGEAQTLVNRFNEAMDPYSSRPEGEGDDLTAAARHYLTVRWGDHFEQNMNIVADAIQRLGGNALEAMLRAAHLRFDPFVVRTIFNVAARKGWADA